MKYREGVLSNKTLYNKIANKVREMNDLYEEIELFDGTHLYFNPFNGKLQAKFPH